MPRLHSLATFALASADSKCGTCQFVRFKTERFNDVDGKEVYIDRKEAKPT